MSAQSPCSDNDSLLSRHSSSLVQDTQLLFLDGSTEIYVPFVDPTDARWRMPRLGCGLASRAVGRLENGKGNACGLGRCLTSPITFAQVPSQTGGQFRHSLTRLHVPTKISVGIPYMRKTRQASQEPAYPRNVLLVNGEQDIVDLDGERPARLPQVLNRPPRGCGAEPLVPRVAAGLVNGQCHGDGRSQGRP